MNNVMEVERMINKSSVKKTSIEIEGIKFYSDDDSDFENVLFTLGEIYRKHGVFTGAFLRSWGSVFGKSVYYQLNDMLECVFYPFETLDSLKECLSDEEIALIDWDRHYEAPEGVIFTE